PAGRYDLAARQDQGFARDKYHDEDTVCPITSPAVELVITTWTDISASISREPPAGGVSVTPSSIKDMAAVARMLNTMPAVYGSALSKVTSPPQRLYRVRPSLTPGSAVNADASVTIV